mgnify:CR=1 FL=1
MTKLRMYDYALGRFTSIDPLADAAGQEVLTPYHFALNNPIRFNDPYGDCVPCLFQVAKTAVKSWWSNNVSGPAQRLASGNSSGIPSEVPVGSATRSQLQTYGKLRDQTTLINSAVDATETVAEGVNTIPGVDVVGDPLLAGYFALKGDEESSASYAAGMFIPFVGGSVLKGGSKLYSRVDEFAGIITSINRKYSNGSELSSGALNSVVNSASYYDNVQDQGSAIFNSIVGHVFENGNKRTASDFITQFATDNNLKLKLDADGLKKLTGEIANGKTYSTEELTKIIFE